MIRLDTVTKSYGAAPVVRDVSLSVPEGCLYGLIGPGASGKSVLLKLVAGLVTPERGRVVIDGTDLASLSDLELQQFRARFGMLFQNNALFDYLTVGENIAFPMRRLTSWSEDEIRARVADRLRAVSLPGFEDRLCAGLSGGQKKRVGVARATVIASAAIVLYDEPAAGLDPVTSQRIFELLREEQRASGTTVVMVSSDLDRMLSVTDRVGMMHRGALVFDGTTEEARASSDPLVRQFVHGLVAGPL